MIDPDIIEVVLYFFVSGILQPGLNSNFLILIPKSEDVDAIEKYRLIMLGIFFSRY